MGIFTKYNQNKEESSSSSFGPSLPPELRQQLAQAADEQEYDYSQLNNTNADGEEGDDNDDDGVFSV